MNGSPRPTEAIDGTATRGVRHVRVTLPIGLADRRGARHRTAVIGPITGQAELIGAEETNPFRVATAVLVGSLSRLGPLQGPEIDAACVNSMAPIDRDYLLIGLDRASHGDVRYHTIACPYEGCGERMDLKLDLSNVEFEDADPVASVGVRLADGRSVHARVPTVGDQAALHDVADDRTAALVERCLVSTSDTLSREDLHTLGDEDRASIAAAVLDATPSLDLTLELQCIACGRPFSFTHDPVRALQAELRQSRQALLKDVHYLAFYYHWGHREILELPRTLRREYLDLVEDELRAQHRGP